MEVFYKPLTPDLRQKAIESINRNMLELRTCEPNTLVQMQITSYQIAKKLINGLPDGYPMPMRKE